jgi:tRNA pseudouridine32 synthase/23S rRNA pseudouridine746 synthase
MQPEREVIHADDALVVLNKPSGLLAVPGKTSNDCLSTRVQQRYADALIVHRLDMSTSGLMVMARGQAVQRLLNAHFAERRVHKRYVAVAHGDCRAPQGASDAATTTGGDAADTGWHTIDLPIIVDWPNRPLRKIDFDTGKPSSTRWRCLSYDAARHASRLELEPLTGRSHQLRVHLQAIGHPILGDALYAPPDIAAQSPRLLLHATELAFAHPVSGEWTSFQCDPEF